MQFHPTLDVQKLQMWKLELVSERTSELGLGAVAPELEDQKRQAWESLANSHTPGEWDGLEAPGEQIFSSFCPGEVEIS